MDEHADDEYEPFWRVVPVSELPFPFHLFRCPFVERHVDALHAVRTNPEEYSTPDQCARAFRLFVDDVGTEIADCPYHLPDSHRAAQRALEAVRRDPDGFDVSADTNGLDDETEWAAWEFFAHPIFISGDRLGNGQHRVCAMKCAGVREIPIEDLRRRQQSR